MTTTGPGRSLPRRVLHALNDIAARIYLALCAVLLTWAIVVTVGDGSDESMAGVIPLLATAPASLVLLALPDGTAMVIAAVVIGALINATFIGFCSRALRRGNPANPVS